jgi:phage gp36-like protein
MPFVTKSDFPASVHIEILDALTREDDTVITDNVSRAVDEIKAYLNGRYNVEADFAKTGTARNMFLVRITVIIALYYIYLVHNPRKLTQVTVDEFNRQITMLEGIQAGKINPVGLTPASDDDDVNSGQGEAIQWGTDEQTQDQW